MENIDTIVTAAASSIQNKTAHRKGICGVCVCLRSEYKFLCARPFQKLCSTQMTIRSIVECDSKKHQRKKIFSNETLPEIPSSLSFQLRAQCKHSQWSNSHQNNFLVPSTSLASLFSIPLLAIPKHMKRTENFVLVADFDVMNCDGLNTSNKKCDDKKKHDDEKKKTFNLYMFRHILVRSDLEISKSN